MRIVMLGHLGVGKTTYMALLYEAMQQQVEGFHLTTSCHHDHPRLLELAQMIRMGTYPPTTVQRDDYEFCLKYQGKEKLKFTWADYRGGTLIERSQGNEQVELLLHDLKQADGIMLFCDSDALANGNLRAIQLGRMTSLVGRALQEVNRTISLTIILTKADLLTSFNSALLSPFVSLVDTINASPWVSGCFIPISCGVRSLNIPMPLLFTLESAVRAQSVAASIAAEQHRKRAQEWIDKSRGIDGFARWVSDKWQGWSSDRELAASQTQQAIKQYQIYESIRAPAQALTKSVQRLPRISKEKTMDTYLQELSELQSGTPVKLEQTHSVHTAANPFDAFN
jgi:Double-GTPase 1